MLDVDGDGWVSIPELLSHKHLVNDLNEEDAKTMLGGERGYRFMTMYMVL